MNLHIDIRGKGWPLVLLHGWGFDHKIWLQLADLIGKKFRLYLVDLPGFGLSPLVPWGTFKESLLQQLPEQFAIAGWSMGGLFATRLALEASERVTHLLNITSSPRFIKENDWPGVEQSIFDGFFKNLTADPQGTITQFVGLQLKNQNYEYSQTLMPAPTSLQAGLNVLANWDLREPLRFFTKPTCFMFGHLDAITPRTTMAIMQKIYPNFDYVMFARAAHMPFMSHQDEFIKILEHLIQ